MNRLLLLGLLGLCCAPTPKDDRRAVWTVSSFSEAQDGGSHSFGGWTPELLLSLPGAPIPFRSGAFSDGVDALMLAGHKGLTVFPGYSAGQPVAYTITDIWYQTPQPWVQPTYLGMTHDGARFTIFPVDVTGSFYSSFWRAEFVSPSFEATSAKEVLDGLAAHDAGMTDGDIILCPLVPEDTAIATTAGGLPVHPFTGRPVAVNAAAAGGSLAPVPAFAEGHRTAYLGFGTWRAQAVGDTLIASKLYVFGRLVDGEFSDLPLPAVLPDDALHDSLMQRVEVTLPDTARAYLPPGRAALAPGLRATGIPLPLSDRPERAVEADGGVVLLPSTDGGVDTVLGLAVGTDRRQVLAVDPGVDGTTGARYMLRVAMNPGCFQPGAGFPDSCQWLDSAANIENALPDSKVQLDVVTLSVGLLEEVP